MSGGARGGESKSQRGNVNTKFPIDGICGNAFRLLYLCREQPALTARTRIYQLAVCQITTIQLLRLKTIGQILQRFKAKQAMISIRQPESIG
jgi:hypothetical protein